MKDLLELDPSVFAEWDKAKPPCLECGAETYDEAEMSCICSGDKDHCHGCDIWV